LVRKHCKNTYVIFANTGIEYPETYKYRDEMLKTMDMNYIETKPIKDFWTCVKEYGYPHFRMTSEQHSNKRTPKCCVYLKERPLKEKQKELGVDLCFMGLMTTESMNRRRLFMRLGAYYYKKSEDINVCLPLAIWTDDDVKRYAKENNIPLNPLYKKMDRTGCMFCSGFKNWKKVMNDYNSKMYAVFLKRKEGQEIIHDCY
jgi:phosphoadenosine phosphosulfate reductase